MPKSATLTPVAAPIAEVGPLLKFLCGQTDLSAGLSLAGRFVPARPTHPVLGNVLLAADVATQRVTLSAFDLSLGIQTSFPAEVEQSGAIALPAKLLSDIVGKLPNGGVTLTATPEFAATIAVQSSRYQVQGMDAEEFTTLPEINGGEPIALPPEAFLEGMRGALFAASSDESKQILTGVHLSVEPDCLEFAATDGHRLAVVRSPLAQDDDADPLTPFAVTIPGRGMREIERILNQHPSSEPIALHCDRGQLAFQWGDYYITSRTLEGQYPAYDQLIPRQFDRTLTLDRKLLLGALDRISVIADQKSNHIIKITLDSEAQAIAISADAQDAGQGCETIESVQIAGEDMTLAFNVKYLIDSLKNLTTTEVQVQMNTPTSPVVITPLGGAKARHLVMPVQVRD